MRFFAIDVETANPSFASICQIGIVEFLNGVEASSISLLIDPEDYFDDINTSIHGIEEHHVKGKPTFLQAYSDLKSLIGTDVTACHTHFDRVAIRQSCLRYGLDEFTHSWIDTARVARHAWEDVRARGFGLSNLAKRFGIDLDHHDAVSDARCAGRILIIASTETGIPLEDWLSHSQKRISLSPDLRQSQTGRASVVRHIEALAGSPNDLIVFTGAMSMRRTDAADMAQAAGYSVASSVTKKTTILVVGDQDIRRLAGQQKSDKHRKAETLIAGGQPIRIVGETDFLALIR